jgi:hypothetical protein
LKATNLGGGNFAIKNKKRGKKNYSQENSYDDLAVSPLKENKLARCFAKPWLENINISVLIIVSG